MSLFSTIAHDGATPARGFSLKGIGMMAAGLALGVGIGFVIINSRTVVEPSSTATASATGLAYDDFLRLNTTDLKNLVPATSAAAIETPVVVDPTVPWWNTESFKNLAPAASAGVIGSQALDANVPWWNTESFKNLVPAVSAAAIETPVVVDPTVPWWNTESFKNLTPAASTATTEAQSVVDPFIYVNTTALQYPAARYSEQPTGPR